MLELSVRNCPIWNFRIGGEGRLNQFHRRVDVLLIFQGKRKQILHFGEIYASPVWRHITIDWQTQAQRTVETMAHAHRALRRKPSLRKMCVFTKLFHWKLQYFIIGKMKNISITVIVRVLIVFILSFSDINLILVGEGNDFFNTIGLCFLWDNYL